AGEQASLIANNRLVVVWLRHDEIMGISGFGRLVNIFRCSVQAAELDIVENGIVKQERLRSNEPHLFTQRFLRDGAQILPIDVHRARSWVVQAQYQRENRAFTRATGDDQGVSWPRSELQGQVAAGGGRPVCGAEW